MPFVVAVNCFDGKRRTDSTTSARRWPCPDDAPMVLRDARERASTKTALLELVQHALARATAASV